MRAHQGAHATRVRRVGLLLAGIVVISAADLLQALAHLSGPGLLEANPVAALVIGSTGSALAISAYKTLTVGICVGLLYRLRRRAFTEVAAWFAIAILAVMSWQWYEYNQLVRTLPPHSMVALGDPWLNLD